VIIILYSNAQKHYKKGNIWLWYIVFGTQAYNFAYSWKILSAFQRTQTSANGDHWCAQIVLQSNIINHVNASNAIHLTRTGFNLQHSILLSSEWIQVRHTYYIDITKWRRKSTLHGKNESESFYSFILLVSKYLFHHAININYDSFHFRNYDNWRVYPICHNKYVEFLNFEAGLFKMGREVRVAQWLVYWTSERTVGVWVPLAASWSRGTFLLELTFVPTLLPIVLRMRHKTEVPCVNACIRSCTHIKCSSTIRKRRP